MADTSDWPSDVIEVLRAATRQHKFDFEKVTIVVQQFCLHHPTYLHLSSHVSEDSCRAQFAADFAKKSSAPSQPVTSHEKTTKFQSQDPVVSTEAIVPLVVETPPLSSAKYSELYKDMSVSEIFALSEKMQADNLKRQDAVFERVLQSMGSLTAASETLQDPNYVMVKSIYEDKKRTREKKEVDRIKKLQEAEEQRELDEQREILRQRFNDCSEDSLQMVPGPVAEGKLPSSLNFGYEDDDDDDISLGDGIRLQFNIDAVLASKAFSDLLDDVERDLGEVQGDENSELAEVFAFLDAAKAEETATMTSKSSHSSQSGLHSHYQPVNGVLDDASFLEFVNSSNTKYSSGPGPSSRSTSKSTSSETAGASRTPSKSSSTTKSKPATASSVVGASTVTGVVSDTKQTSVTTTPAKLSTTSSATTSSAKSGPAVVSKTISELVSTPSKLTAPVSISSETTSGSTKKMTGLNITPTAATTSGRMGTVAVSEGASLNETVTPTAAASVILTPGSAVVSGGPKPTSSSSAPKGRLFKSSVPDPDEDDEEDEDWDKVRRNMKQSSQKFSKLSPLPPVAAGVVQEDSSTSSVTPLVHSNRIVDKPVAESPSVRKESSVVNSKVLPQSEAFQTQQVSTSQAKEQSETILPPPAPTQVEEVLAAAISIESVPVAAPQVSGSLLSAGRQKRDGAQTKTPMNAQRVRKDLKDT